MRAVSSFCWWSAPSPGPSMAAPGAVPGQGAGSSAPQSTQQGAQMHATRLVRAVCASAALLLALFPSTAAAHSRVSVVRLTVSGGAGMVTVRAVVTYPDNDPVVGETVVGVAYQPTSGRVLPLTLRPVAQSPGVWLAQQRLASGPWQAEVDAVVLTQGAESVGFTMTAQGGVTSVVSPSPLPAGVPMPQAPRAAQRLAVSDDAAGGLQLPWGVVAAVSLAGVLSLLSVLAVAMRRARQVGTG